jgi:formyl-CoA transferase
MRPGSRGSRTATTVDAMAAEWGARARRGRRARRACAPRAIPAAPVRSYAEAAADPHVRAREMLQEWSATARACRSRDPRRSSRARRSRVRSAARELGADTEAVLDELGVSRDERRALRARASSRARCRRSNRD